jgi:hypothetical protein
MQRGTNPERSIAMSEDHITRRDVIKKAAYMTPVILTFLAAPSFASGGSGRDQRDESDWNDQNDRQNDSDRRDGSPRRKRRRLD